jgi:hypothetical protein
MIALLCAMGTVLIVLLAYIVAELYLFSQGWLVALPDGLELAHQRMRNLLLMFATPVMAVLGFGVGWFIHPPQQPPRTPPQHGGPDEH